MKASCSSPGAGKRQSHHVPAGRRREDEVQRRSSFCSLTKGELQPLPVICWEGTGSAVVKNHLLGKLGLSRPLLIPQPSRSQGCRLSSSDHLVLALREAPHSLLRARTFSCCFKASFKHWTLFSFRLRVTSAHSLSQGCDCACQF